tara:strand:- start:1176 stop:2087 length:912 start_codon:yes stop_codon:yes gene_type:complete
VIDGTDQASIKIGMQNALSSLLINVTGNSKILKNKNIGMMMNSPETYISQYKLGSDNDEIVASFIFEGDVIRNFLSENELPIWLSNQPLILSFLPCMEMNISEEMTDELKKCNNLEEDLRSFSQNRLTKITSPLMDLTDLNYYESLNSHSINIFMKKLSRRYEISSWITCLIKDQFGFLLDEPECISSYEKTPSSLEKTFNDLLDNVNFKRSLVVNKTIQNSTQIKLEGINSFYDLKKTLEDLNTQVLIYDVAVLEITGEDIKISLSHYGSEEDLINLLDIHKNYKKIITFSKDIISFKYVTS